MIAATTTEPTGSVGGFLILIAVVAAYFLPTIIAALRKRNTLGVFIVNLLTAWTVVGWIIALVMACGNNDRVVIHNHHQ